MKHPNRVGDLTVTDLARLSRAMDRLDALDTAIASTSMQGKAAVRLLLVEVFREIEAIFSRGAIAFGNHVTAGYVPGIELDAQFWERAKLVYQARTQTPAAAGEGEAAPVAQEATRLTVAEPVGERP